MGNEVIVEVSAVDTSAATKDEIKASWQAFEKTFQPIDIRATNPINSAFVAQVKASVKAISEQALEIPVDADLMPFKEQVESVLTNLAMTAKGEIPLEVGDAIEFRAQVLELVEQVSGSVKAVIGVEVDDAGLTDLQAKTVAASQATVGMVAAQQKLDQALATGDDEQVAKARLELAAATQEADRATGQLEAAQIAAAAGAEALTEGEKAATVAAGGMRDAMGPLWAVMNVAQIAMFGMYSAAGSTSSAAQDMSQQIVSLGNSTGQTALNLIGGNQALQNMAGQLSAAGTSAAAFSQAFSGGSASMQQYHDALVQQRDAVGALPEVYKSAYTSTGQFVAGGFRVKQSVADIAGEVNRGSLALSSLPQPVQDAVNKFNNLNGVLPQVQNALNSLRDAEQASRDAAGALGFTMTSTQVAAQNYGLGVQAAAKALADAVSGSTYLENATDKASITAGQGVQQWKQLQQAVTSAQQAYDQAGQSVLNAEHSVATASQAVASAKHSEEQATQAVQSAQQAYTNSLYQEAQAEQAVTAARAAAEAQLISLTLQAKDAAASADSANLSLYNATQAAAKVGVNAGNAQAFADLPVDQINAANAAQVAAADALIQAQNQVADAQNSSVNAQNDLNTARQQGVDNNPQVLAAEHALAQAQQGVQTAANGVANAQYAQQQAALAVSNAEWGLQQASVAVKTAQQAETTASQNLQTARDNENRTTDASTLIGAQNRQEIEQIYEAYRDEYGSAQIAAQMTQTVGEKMGFTSGQIGDVIGSLNGLNGMQANFGITGTPSLNPQQLTQIGQELGMSFSAIEQALPGPGQAGYHSGGRAKATGGPTGGLTWVGEQGAELVDLPYGSEVIPHANAMQRAALGEVPFPEHATGGPVGASAVLGANLPLAAQWGALDTVGQMLHVLGGPAVKLPPAGAVDWGAFGGMPGSVPGVPSSRAANEAAVQAVFSQFGWGSGPEWDAAVRLIMMESGFNNTAQNPTSSAYGIFQFLDCVPLDTEILTQDGWKSWDTVQAGDRTLGYNRETGRTEWTPILAKVVKPAQRVVQMKVGNWSARVTPGHRWMSERRTTPAVSQHQLECPLCGKTRSKRGPFASSRAVQTHIGRVHGQPRARGDYVRLEEFVRTDSITKAHRLRVAAEVDDTGGNDALSDAEVALLGWIVGDGHINHANRTVNVWIYQAKTRFLPVIDALLDGIPHSRYVRDRNPGKHLPSVAWRLSSPYARSLLERSRLLDGTPEQFVLSLSSKQRDVWLDAVWQAEGWLVQSGPDGAVRRLSQNVGPWADAMTLAAYLCGYRPTRHLKRRDNPKHSDNWVITLGRPWVGGTEIEFTEVGDEPVWCVNTELGTWTMRQNGLPMLTGNSTWAGYGVQKTSDPTQQAWGGARYIGARYHDPLGALAHENAYRWYAGGGPASGRVGVGDRGPELVRLPGGGGSGSQSISVDLSLHITGDTDSPMATAIMRLIREDKIQLVANVNGTPARVKVG